MVSGGKKECTKCGRLKLLSEFYDIKDKNGKIYKRRVCIACYKKGKHERYLRNCEVVKAKQHVYYYEHLPERNEYQRKYRESHLEERRAYSRRWDAENRERKNKRQSEYLKTEAGKLSNARHEFKRRELKFDPINRKFPDAEFHHLHTNGNKGLGVFIPKDLHSTVWHERAGGEGLKQMNMLAMSWVISQAVAEAMALRRQTVRFQQLTLSFSF